MELFFQLFLKEPSYFSAKMPSGAYAKMMTLFTNRAFDLVNFSSSLNISTTVPQNLSCGANITIAIVVVLEIAFIKWLRLFTGCLL